MGLIFISHSSRDNDFVQKVFDFLVQLGHKAVFLDFDPDNGIPAGRTWENELYSMLRRCQVVIVVYSKSFSASKWCFAEITQARALGKYIIPIQIEECPVISQLSDLQIIDAGAGGQHAFKKLERGLFVAGVGKETWDHSRPPYPGLSSFEEEDAPIFFGRRQETEDLLKKLRQYARFGGPQLLVVAGASGSGKSSLIKAGLLPHLRREGQAWTITGPFRPLKNPLEQLSKSLSAAMTVFNLHKSAEEIYALLINDSKIPSSAAGALHGLLQELTVKTDSRSGINIVLIDQFEELLASEQDKAAGEETEAAKHAFITYLRLFLERNDHKNLVICTLSSDFLGAFQNHPVLKEIALDYYMVKSVTSAGLEEAIVGPAEIAGIALEPGLVNTLLQDTGTSDALPLLAFTLRELWEQYGGDGKLEQGEYKELGGLGGSIARAAEAVLKDHVAKSRQGRIEFVENREQVVLPDEDEKLLKAAFREMVRIDERHRYTKRPASWDHLSAKARPLLKKFVAARLLRKYSEGTKAKIEVAHEALFRTWNRLAVWLDNDKAFLTWRHRLHLSREEWNLQNKSEESLLRGPALSEAIQWFDQSRNGQIDLAEEEKQFILLSEKKAHEVKQREEVRKVRELRNLRILFGVSALIVLLIGASGIWLYRDNVRTTNALAKSYWDKSKVAGERGDFLTAVHYVAEGVSICLDADLSKCMLMDAESYLSTALPKQVFPSGLQVLGTASSPDGRKIFTSELNGTARIWDIETVTPIGKPLRHGGFIYSAIFSPDGKQILTFSQNSTYRIWDTDLGIPIGKPLQYNAIVEGATFSADGKQIFIAGPDSMVSVLDAKTGSPIGNPLRYGGAMYDAIFHPDRKQILTLSYDGTAKIWDTKTGTSIGSPLQHKGTFNSASVSSDGMQIVTVSRDSTARIWNAKTGALIGSSLKHDATVTSAIFSPDGKQIVTVSRDSTVRVWNAKTGLPIGNPLRHDWFIYTAIFSPDGKQILTLSHDSTARIWNTKTGVPIANFPWHEKLIYGVTFSPDGKHIVKFGLDRTVSVWDAKTGLPIGNPLQYEALVYSAIFSPDGKQIITVSRDSTVRFWDARTRLPVGNPLRHEGFILNATFSPNGKQIVTANQDGTVRVWDSNTKLPIGIPLRHNAAVNSAVFSSDGKQIVTVSQDSTVRIWDARTRLPIGSPLRHNTTINSADLSTDGKQIITVSRDSTARIWDIGGDWDLPGDLFKLQVKALTAGELNAETGEVITISRERFLKLKDEYHSEGKLHYKTCHYRQYNIWSRHFPDEAKTIQ